MNFAFDEAELEHGQNTDHDHQQDRLGRTAAQVRTKEPVDIDLVDKRCGRPAGRSFGRYVNDAERFKEGVRQIDHQQEEGGCASNGNVIVQNRRSGLLQSSVAASCTDLGMP